MLNYDISAQVILGTTEDDDEQIWVGRSDLKFWTKIKAPKICKSEPKIKKNSSVSSSLPSAYFSEIQENTIPPTEAELRQMFEQSRNQSRYLGSLNSSNPNGNFEE